MINDILSEISALEDIDDAKSERYCYGLKEGTEEALDSIKDAKDFDSVRYSTKKA